MPVVSPEARSSKVVASSSGISSRSMTVPRSARTVSTAWRRIVRFDSPRKSNLSSPSASIACISYWVISPSELVAFWSGISSVSGSRLMTTPAAWVEALRATPSSWRAKSMIRLTPGSASTCSRSAGATCERLVEPDAELVRDRLRDAVHLAVGVAEDAADVADRGPGQHRAEGDDLGDVVLAVLAPDVGDDLVAPAVLEVHVDVGHRHAVRVEEALERELVEDRVHRRDPERVGHDAARGAAAAGRLDPLLAREADEVRHDQEVAGVAHRQDHAQLVVEALLQLRGHRPVAALEAALALGPQPALDRVALGDREVRDAQLAERQRDVGHLRDAPAVPDRVGVVREERRHLGRRLHVELGAVEPHAVGRVEVVAGAHAEQDVVRLGLVLADVVEVVGDDQRQPGLRGEPEELLVEPPLLGQSVVLELEEEPVLAEDVAVLAGDAAGELPVVDLERLGDLAAQARRQPDEPRAVLGEVVAVDARLVVVAVEVGVGRRAGRGSGSPASPGRGGSGGRAGCRPCPPCRSWTGGRRRSRCR